MKFEISEKDKKLLVFLSIFIIVVCIGYWGVYPRIKEITKLKTDIEEEKTTKESNEMKIMQLPMLQVETEELEEKISETKMTYFPMMDTSEIDRVFTYYVLSYDLYSYDLSISISEEEVDLEPYQYSEKKEDEKNVDGWENNEDYLPMVSGDESASPEDDLSDATLSDDKADSGVYSAGITMKIGGEKDKLIKFIDDIFSSDEKILVKNYTITEERGNKNRNTSEQEEENEESELEIYEILTINFEIYMCED